MLLYKLEYSDELRNKTNNKSYFVSLYRKSNVKASH